MKARRNMTILLTLCSITLPLCLVACGPKTTVVGQWDKLQGVPCGLVYPSKVEFFRDETYTGALPLWNGGKYDLVDSNRIKLDTLTGPGVYEFKVADDVLTFRNNENCEFRYRRAK